MSVRGQPRIVVVYNRDFEGADADPENRAREDVRDIADHVAGILNAADYRATTLPIGEDVVAAMQAIRAHGPAAVFNLCESVDGDNRFESLLPMLLELDGIGFTGSPSFALALALRKDKVKEVLRARGVPVPRGLLLSTADLTPAADLRFPVIVKPSREDASVGITSASVVHDQSALSRQVTHVLGHYNQPALVEEYIDGREIYVSFLGRPDGPPEILPFYEIDFSELPADRPRIVSFEGKWVEASVEYRGTRPVRCEGLEPAVLSRLVDTARAAFEAIELRDYGRVDVRMTADGTPFVIDVNPNCDLSHQSGGFARAARAAGHSYEHVIQRLIDLALARNAHADKASHRQGSRGAHTADRA